MKFCGHDVLVCGKRKKEKLVTYIKKIYKQANKQANNQNKNKNTYAINKEYKDHSVSFKFII